MPPERRQPQKNRRLPFNPPRPRTSTASVGPSTTPKSNTKGKGYAGKGSASVSKAGTSRKSTVSRQRSPSVEASSVSSSVLESVSESTTRRSRENSLSSEEPNYMLAEIITDNREDVDVMSSEPTIPPKLLTRLLHHHFQNEKTKIGKDANEVVAKYVDIFVREALARAAYERSESEGGVGANGKRAVGDGFLEVEDLEKMAPQLVLDF
ncbi:hypothetical protein MPDQ_000270 [Monascus purpureus]|uniref:Uncharacterized protein n=1 Tax=Monascus purpureus TaxID=5098 RepID=A0A507QSM0_MONPU|nr:hypothetical protein MPDQ_000270 [Monascus purpureus]